MDEKGTKKDEYANIDKDILELAIGEKAYNSVKDPVLRERVLLNFLAETLAMLKAMRKDVEEISRAFTICSYDKQLDFFTKAKDNIDKRDKAQAIVKQSHQMPVK